MKIYGEEIDDRKVKQLFGEFPKKRQNVVFENDEIRDLTSLELCVFMLHVAHWIPRRYIYRMLRIKNDVAEDAYYNACLKLGVTVRYQIPKEVKERYKRFTRRRILLPLN